MLDDDYGQNLTLCEKQFILQLDLENELAFDSSDAMQDVVPSINTDIGKPNYENERLVFDYLDKIITNNPIKCTDDFKGLQWLNISKSISLKDDLSGLLVLCDFFTYCCINCLHVLPFLHQVEQKCSSKEVMFLGVHSPKFDNEKSFENVADAILRYNITHPVCNDPDLKLWNQLSINCWPSIAILGPSGELLFVLVGEKAIQHHLEFYVDNCLKYFHLKNQLFIEKKLALSAHLSKGYTHTNLLYYPSKIAVSPSNLHVAISSTLKNSIIVASVNGSVQHIIGSNDVNLKGFCDSTLEQSLFDGPQGLTWINDELIYVCDTGNHAIRRIDLKSNVVQTVAGNGKMGDDKIGGLIGTEQALNSPWDIVHDSVYNRLYIAMAGLHQIWVLILSEDGDNLHQTFHPHLVCLCFAGDGNEQQRNNRSLLRSSFAQPSGIALRSQILYIADSESSSIRKIDLTLGQVTTVAGANLNPQDLFAFGDTDGIGLKSKFQHCMGVCVDNQNHNIYVADTFNHKIKKIEINTKKCETIHAELDWSNVGDKKYFNEPNGLSFYSDECENQKYLLIVDTNNHRILSVNLESASVSNFKLNFSNFVSKSQLLDVIDYGTKNIRTGTSIDRVEDCVQISDNQNLDIIIKFNFIGSHKADINAKHKIKLLSKDSIPRLTIEPSKYFTTDLSNIRFNISCSQLDCQSESFEVELIIECQLNLCDLTLNCCTIHSVAILQPVSFSSSTNNEPNFEKCIEINI